MRNIKVNLLKKFLQASETHQVTTMRLHRNAQQQITDGADKFRMDLLSIFIGNFFSWHLKRFNCKQKQVNLMGITVRCPVKADYSVIVSQAMYRAEYIIYIINSFGP